MAHMQVVVVYAAPIAVGRWVTVRWYRKDSPDYLGAKTYEPVIIDHDTGIEWLSDFAHSASGMKSPDTPLAMSKDANGGFEVDREIVGRVTACRVVHVRAYSQLDVQTHLEIETT